MKKFLSLCTVLSLGVAFLTSCGGTGVKLSGTIRDSIKLELLKDVQIKIGDQVAVTDEEGRFVLENLKSGENDIQVTLDGYKTVEYTGYILKEGENFLETTLEKGTGSANVAPKPVKPMPNPPPVPGKPVKDRPALKVFRDYSNCEILLVQGDLENPGMANTFQVSGGTIKITQKVAGLSVIQTSDATYNEISAGKWIGMKMPAGIKPPNPSDDLTFKFQLILEAAQDLTSNFNLVGPGKHDKWAVDKYHLVGYAKDPTSSADGEIWVVSKGPDKGVMVSFEGKLTINGSGDAYTIRISKVGAVPPIKMPANVEMMPAPPPIPGSTPVLTPPLGSKKP